MVVHLYLIKKQERYILNEKHKVKVTSTKLILGNSKRDHTVCFELEDGDKIKTSLPVLSKICANFHDIELVSEQGKIFTAFFSDDDSIEYFEVILKIK